jgi:hypothetical protein
MSKYLLDGDIRNADLAALERALSGPEWTIANRGDELELEADGLVIDIYDHAADQRGRQFLISGQLDHDLPTAKALLDALGARLRAHGVPYSLELADDQGNQVHDARDLGGG